MLIIQKTLIPLIISFLLFGAISITNANSSEEITRENNKASSSSTIEGVKQCTSKNELRTLRKKAKKEWKAKKKEVRKKYRTDRKAARGDKEARKAVKKEYKEARKELRKERRSIRKLKTLQSFKNAGYFNGEIVVMCKLYKTGARGGCYYLSANDKKIYVERKMCKK